MTYRSQDAAVIADLKTHLAVATGRAHVYDAYYEGRQRIEALGRTLPPELRLIPVIVNWPRLVVDALEERLDVEGFRIQGSTRADNRLWDIFTDNELPAEASLLNQEAFAHGRAYTAIGSPDSPGDSPVITVESSHNMYADIDPRTRKVNAAIRVIYDPDTHVEIGNTLYLPNQTVVYQGDTGGPLELTDVIQHDLGIVPVVPFVNRGRIHDRYGRSEMHDAMGLTDSACRALSNLQVAQDFMAVPQRYALGAKAEDFKDKDGNVKPAWEAYISRFLALGNENAKVGQLSAAELSNFTSTVQSYATFLAGVYGLPPNYVGIPTANPASADAIRAGEGRWIKRAERRIAGFTPRWALTMKIALMLAGEDNPPRITPIWRDPATPTRAAMADAATKLYGGGVLPLEATWQELGYSPERIAELRQMQDDEPATAFLNRVAQADPTQGAPAPEAGQTELDASSAA